MSISDTRFFLTSLMLAIGSMSAVAEPISHVLGDGVQARCEQLQSDRVDCRYRLFSPRPIQSINATLNGEDVPIVDEVPRSATGAVTAILFLIDTSDPARQTAVEAIASHVSRLMAQHGAGHRFGIANFDTNLSIMGSIGTPIPELNASLSKIRAVGRTAPLYRNAREAIRLLAAYPADRRALYVFSDGLAEDRAYFHEDVVRAALDAGVTIVGVGYPRSASLSVGLQTLRRLADETGGTYAFADTAFRLPDSFFEAPFAAIDNGGVLGLDLSEFEAEDSAIREAKVRIEWLLASGVAAVSVPVVLPAPPAPEPVVRVVEVEVPKVVEVPTVIEVPVPAEAPAPTPVVPAAPPPAASRDPLMLYATAAVLGLLLILVALVLVLFRARRRAGDEDSDSEIDPRAVRTFASLELQDGSGSRNPISSAAYRIGRHADNDLTLRDPSISRYHAEVRRSRDGKFTAIDLDSLNGVFVNGKKTKSSALVDGDRLEIGDVMLKFFVQYQEDVGDEETVVLKTVVPVAPMPETGGQRA